MLRELIVEYGLPLVFANVLLESLGVPIPALPTLILAAAITSGIHVDGTAPGLLSHPRLLAIAPTAVIATILGDLLWYWLGRKYGNRALGLLCRMSISRDTCVTRSGYFFDRFGVKLLMVSKFLPGLSTLAIPVAGATGIRFKDFMVCDAVGATLWATSGVVAGVAFADAVDTLLYMLEKFGQGTILLTIIALVFYAGARWWRRASLLRRLRSARIAPAELAALLSIVPPPCIVDARQPHRRRLDPFSLPGAIMVVGGVPGAALANLPRNTLVVFYCDCPNEISAALMADNLIKAGCPNVMVLTGGLDGWRAAGLPLESMLQDPVAADHRPTRAHPSF